MLSTFLRTRAPSQGRFLASRALGTYATFKIPQINNEPNVRARSDFRGVQELI